MPVIRVDSIDDPRLAPYRQLKERELARNGDRFIAESANVVRRLLSSAVRTESLLISERHVEEFHSCVPADVPVYVTSAQVINRVVGYRFHSGVLACGVRPPSRSLVDVVPAGDRPCTLVLAPDLNNTENLGGIIRIAAAFGVDALVLGENSCDPFFRQSVRVSMGTVFSLPVVRSQNFADDLHRLRRDCNVQLVATVLDESAESLSGFQRARRTALLFGSEAQGLDSSIVAGCDRRVTIPMKLGTDSLNVMVAAGIFLHHFTSSRDAV